MKILLATKKLFVTRFIICVICAAVPAIAIAQISDNQELIELAKDDQKRRSLDNDEPLEPKDQLARQKVMALLSAGLVRTFEDKMNAALILQHTALTFCNGELKSISPENYYLAYSLAKNALDSGYKPAANFVATTYDRYLLYTVGYQKYGTQMVPDEKTGESVWAPIDPTTTDEERKKFNVKPLAELLKRARMKPFEQKK